MVGNYLEILREDLRKTFSDNATIFETIINASSFAKRQVLYSLTNETFLYYQERLAVALLRKKIEPTVNKYEIEQAMKYYDQQIEKIDTVIKETLALSGILTEQQIASFRKTACRNADREIFKVCLRTASKMITKEAQQFIPKHKHWY